MSVRGDDKPILLTEAELRTILSGAGLVPLRDDEFRDLLDNGMPGPVVLGLYDVDACFLWCVAYWQRLNAEHEAMRARIVL